MQFPTYFKRSKGSVSDDPAIGTAPSDATPLFTTARWASTKDNVLEFKTLDAKRIAVGYWFDSPSPVALPVTLWVWDERSEKYFKAATGTLTSGEITYLKCPNIPPARPGSRQGVADANTFIPDQGMHFLLQVADNSSPTGVHHIVAGPDAAIGS